MVTPNIRSLADATNRDLKNRFRNRVIGAPKSAVPRFELYHAGASLCSHKVRTVLAEKEIPYFSHDMNLPGLALGVPENYRPSYVRLRMQGAVGATLVRAYSGRSSLSTEGFDPCVVPTLVDHEKSRVVIDSSRICKYLDEEAGTGPVLIPEALGEEVERQIALVDEAPHVALLYGAHPDGDRRPRLIVRGMTGIQNKKIKALESQIALVQNDPVLVSAYQSKISKESESLRFVSEPKRMNEVLREMEEHVAELDQHLSTHDGPWVCGERFTLADIVWTTSLFRMKWIGIGRFWEEDKGRCRVAGYANLAFQRPSFRHAVIDWPNAYAPSPYVPEFSTPLAWPRFFWRVLRSARG